MTTWEKNLLRFALALLTLMGGYQTYHTAKQPPTPILYGGGISGGGGSSVTSGSIATALGYIPVPAGSIRLWHAGAVTYYGSSFSAAITQATTDVSNDRMDIGPGTYTIVAQQTLPIGLSISGDSPDTTSISSSLAGIMLLGSGNNTIKNVTITSSAPTTGGGAGGNPLVWEGANNRGINLKLHGNSDCCTTTDTCTDYTLIDCTGTFGFDGFDCSSNSNCAMAIIDSIATCAGESGSSSCIGQYGTGSLYVSGCRVSYATLGVGTTVFGINCGGSATLIATTISTPTNGVGGATVTGVDIGAGGAVAIVSDSCVYDPTKVTATLTPLVHGRTAGTKFLNFVAAPTNTASTSTTLTLTANTQYTFNGSSAATWTLPARSSSIDQPIWIKNRGTAILTISRAGSDNLYTTASVTTFNIMPGGEWCECRAGTTFWYIGGTPAPATIPVLASYASGTAYTITATPATVTFGTTSPSITLTPGKWRVSSKINVQNNGATFAASRTVTCKLRDTTNSADLTNGSDALITGVVTTITSEAGDCFMESEYTVAANAVVVPFASIDVVPTAGSIQCVAPGTWIKATYLGPQ